MPDQTAFAATAPSEAHARRSVIGALFLITAAVLAAYANSFSGPFVFDDPSSIVANPTIRHLWPPWEMLSPPNVSITAQGRPVLNISLALNYALSGTDVWSYHAFNVAIHLFAAFALFGVVRRTLLRPALRARFGDAATGLALAVAGIWAVHPLQTESVTYIIQRAESLMGLFYFVTLYCFVRGAECHPIGDTSLRGWREGTVWFWFSVGACLLGMATKEVMVTAPLLVLLCDRTFFSGSFRAAWRQHRWLYTGLGATWLLLVVLVVAGGGNRGGSVGVGVGIAWWAYPLTQFQAVGRYLLLSLWPYPLVFEYGTYWVTNASEVIPWSVPILALLAGTVIALWRRPVDPRTERWAVRSAPGSGGGRPLLHAEAQESRARSAQPTTGQFHRYDLARCTRALGFLGAWFFLILAPTSLAPGTTQMIVEHRMYLPLAAITALAILGLYTWLRAWNGVVGVAFALLGIALVVTTGRRNHDYRSEVALWQDTVTHRPDNPLAHQLLAIALEKDGDSTRALDHYETALRLKPNFALAHDTLGLLLFRLGRRDEAAAHFEAALALQPSFADAHDHLGVALAKQRHWDEAIAQHETALRFKADFPDAHFNLANALAGAGRVAEAVAHFESALRLRPDFPAAHYNLANLLADSGRPADAIPHYEAAVKLRPDYAEAFNNLGGALLDLGRRDEAISSYEHALRINPRFSDARENLERVRASARDSP